MQKYVIMEQQGGIEGIEGDGGDENVRCEWGREWLGEIIGEVGGFSF